MLSSILHWYEARVKKGKGERGARARGKGKLRPWGEGARGPQVRAAAVGVMCSYTRHRKYSCTVFQHASTCGM